MITGSQVKTARKLLGWSQAQLAEHANVAEGTVNKLELGIDGIPLQRLAAIRRALEVAGVEFRDHETVRRKFTRATWDPPPDR